jgi:hypothetical protein
MSLSVECRHLSQQPVKSAVVEKFLLSIETLLAMLKKALHSFTLRIKQ